MNTTNTSRVALILGGTGTIGAEVGRVLLARGWTVRALHRNPANLPVAAAPFDWVQGDAMNRQDVLKAAQGVDLIVHAVNPPGYHNWAGLVLPMIDNTIAAARAARARILLPGTVYNFGTEAFPILKEDAPQKPFTRKGTIRVELERRLREASENGVRTIVVRAGDFFGPGCGGNSWFSGALVKPGKPVKTVQNPAAEGIGHQWAYVPDVAETMVRLVELGDRLPAFASYHMAGHWDADGSQMVDAIRRASGSVKLNIRRIPWWIFRLAAPFNETLREMLEMRYLWQRPLRMDNAHLRATLGEEPHTPWDIAVRKTLSSMGCIA
ncbi:MAG TPA: NAD-dependent epimerase/dehydratase family protein [Burkholderiaceae bacterium]